MKHLLLLHALSQPAAATEAPAFWSPDGPPAHLALDTPTFVSLQPVLHGPDNSSGADVPAGGFKYKKKKKPILSYVGAGLSVTGLLYLAGSRTASFEARDAQTQADRDAYLKEQSNKRTIGFTMLGTAGACFVLDIFI